MHHSKIKNGVRGRHIIKERHIIVSKKKKDTSFAQIIVLMNS